MTSTHYEGGDSVSRLMMVPGGWRPIPGGGVKQRGGVVWYWSNNKLVSQQPMSMQNLDHFSTPLIPTNQSQLTRDRVCVCVLTRSLVQGGFARTRYQLLASPSPQLEAALTKIKVLPKILNRTPAGCSLWRRSCSEALAMSAKLGSHGGKDIAKVMAITNGSTKRGS